MSVCCTKVLFHFCCCCSACRKSPQQLYFTGCLYSLIFLFRVVVVTGCYFYWCGAGYRSWSVSGFISDKQGTLCLNHWRIVQRVDSQTVFRQQRQSFYSLFPTLRNREILAYSLLIGISQTEKYETRSAIGAGRCIELWRFPSIHQVWTSSWGPLSLVFGLMLAPC